MRVLDQKINPLISIHALREESDPTAPVRHSFRLLFQSTLSVRRATGYFVAYIPES